MRQRIMHHQSDATVRCTHLNGSTSPSFITCLHVRLINEVGPLAPQTKSLRQKRPAVRRCSDLGSDCCELRPAPAAMTWGRLLTVCFLRLSLFIGAPKLLRSTCRQSRSQSRLASFSFFWVLRPRAASTGPASDALYFSDAVEPAKPIATPRRSNTE